MREIIRTVVSTIPADTTAPFLKGLCASSLCGEISKDLQGIYVRNTHNQVHDSVGIYHPFDGDNTLHTVHFQGGKASFRNRFVETTGWWAEQSGGPSSGPAPNARHSGDLAPDIFPA